MKANDKGQFMLHIKACDQDPEEEGNWCDKVEILLQASFQILVNFIEDEKENIDCIAWDADDEHRHAFKTMNELYDWYKARGDRVDPLSSVELPESTFTPGEDNKELLEWGQKFKSPEHEKGWDAACKEYNRLEAVWLKEDQDMLHRLIDIREYLWT